MENKNSGKDIDVACDQALARFGFHSPRRGNPLLTIDEDIYGWVGLNRFKVGNSFQMSPFVGLHSVSVMRLWNEINPRNKKKYVLGSVATAAVHLRELAPDLRIFVFESPGQYDEEAGHLARAIAEVGVPWMKSNANLPALLELVRERESMLGGFPERAAVILFLLKRFDELSNYLDERLAAYQKRPNWEEVCESWSQFSCALRDRMR